MREDEIRKIVKSTIKELNNQPRNTYKRTEALLHGYAEYKVAIKMKKNIDKNDKSIARVEKYLDMISIAVSSISNKNYIKIIHLYFFEKKTIEEVAEIMNTSVSTVSRQRKRAVDKVRNILFTDEVIEELLKG